jgi:L-alanine-DL-glutamate epimerase-like enolase superfamily enzyme
LRELVDNQASDTLQRLVCFCGGIGRARKAAHLAQATPAIAKWRRLALFNMKPCG